MMGSWFDTRVRNRREHTPFASIGLLSFIRRVIGNKPYDAPAYEHTVVLTVASRPDVASRLWYEIEWTGPDGKRLQASSQEFDLLMWRAAETELTAEQKEEGFDIRENLVKQIAAYQEQLALYDEYHQPEK
jgi:hypothetical protein